MGATGHTDFLDAEDLPQIAGNICQRLAIGHVIEILPLHQGYENFNCRLRTSGGEFVLRRYCEQSGNKIATEIRVLRWLADLGYPAIAPLEDSTGESILPEPVGESLWAVFPFVLGEEPKATPVTAAAVGTAIGRLHTLPDSDRAEWDIENQLSTVTTVGVVESVAARRPEHCSHLVPRFESLIEEIVPKVQRLELPSGLIHGDLFPDNTLFQGDRLVAVLDFGQVCRDAFLFDVAMALHGFCICQDKTLDADSFLSFLSAYQARRKLTNEELEALSLYLRWCPLTMAAWHYARFAAKPNARQGTRICELLDLAEAEFPVNDLSPHSIRELN